MNLCLVPGNHLKFLFLLLFMLPVSGWGQTPLKVGLCDLMKDPQKYSRQWVEVRAAVSIGFEDFTLRTGDCGGSRLPGIWLAYGGDEPTPITSLVNDRTRQPGAVIKVEGIPVALDRNVDMDLFKERLMARRVTAPDGSSCGEGCRLYDVTATFTGLFMALPKDGSSGYGHIGCCHLLTIQRVADVDAVRTEIPAGGRFTCSQETWEINQTKVVGDPFSMVAQHWGDDVELNKGTMDTPEIGASEWRSADMLTTYLLESHHDDERHGTETLLNATATRTFCKPTEPPYPQTIPIRCKYLFSDFDVLEKKSEGPQNETQPGTRWTGDPETVARPALEEAAKRWSISLLPGLRLEECGKPVVNEGDQFTWCSWTEPTSMQSFSIEIARSHFARHAKRKSNWNNMPWQLTSGDGLACTAEAR